MKTSRKQMTRIPIVILILLGLLLIGGVSAAESGQLSEKMTIGSMFGSYFFLTGEVGRLSEKTPVGLELDGHTSPVSEFAPWSVQTVANAGKVGEYSSLALDSTGKPRISYYDQTNKNLNYASWDGTKWFISTVDSSKKVGEYSSLALDSTGNPRISYYEKNNDNNKNDGKNNDDDNKGNLKYASLEGTVWVTSTVDSSKKVGKYPSLALDSSGKPRISYYDETNKNLKYASLEGTVWVTSTVDSSKKVGEYSSLALDSSGKPRISYYDETNKNLNYASWDGTKWVILTVDSSKKVGKYSSLALDSTGNPRISYYEKNNDDNKNNAKNNDDDTKGNLKYASWNGKTWDISTVDSSKKVGEYASLKLDVKGDPRISYYDASNHDLKFAAWNRTTSQWVTETVDSSKKVGTYTSLTLDSLGNPRISYYDQSNKDLKYAAGTGHVQNPTTPTITGISPANGPASGGTVVNITGFRFTGATSVRFGTTESTIQAVSDTIITVTSPAGSAGIVDITVTTLAGTSAISSSDQFTYIAAPTVTSISPVSGPVSGGTVVTITGNGFTGVTKVKFGTIDGIIGTVTDTEIKVTSPAGAAGSVDVTVTTLGGTSATSTGSKFTYIAAPTVTSISPEKGPVSGGTVVTINGNGFTGVTKVTFGTKLGTSLTVTDDTQISITSPAGTTSGPVDVTVTTLGGATSSDDKFTYIAAPTVTGISPASGPVSSDTVVTITGNGFTDATKVTFGTIDGIIGTVTDTEIKVTSPAGAAGSVDVTVTTLGGTSAAGSKFTYIAAPTVTGISPASGPVSGGTVVTITGTGFTDATEVRFGTSLATLLTFINDTHIHITSPDDITDRTVDVTVTTLGGTSATSTGSRFTYIAVSTVTDISPSSGPVSGGKVVTITGTGLTGVTAVTFGGTTATVFSRIDDTSITATTPAHAAGVVDVIVTTPNGAATGAITYTYVAPPTVTGIDPATGVADTSVLVTLTGDGFLSNANVQLTKDGQAPVIAVPVSVDSSNKITCTLLLPASSAAAVGSWNVVVKNADGQSVEKIGAFTVVYPDPTILTITPLTSAADTTVNMVITGKDFRYGQNPTIWLEKAGAISIPGTSINVIEPNTIKCSFILPKDTSIGDWSIMVQYPSGNPASKIGLFQVTPPVIYSETWDWSTKGWTGWQSATTLTVGSSVEYGPVVETAGYGAYGSTVTNARSGILVSSVSKVFTAPSGSKYSSLTFTGMLNSITAPATRTLTINVNGLNYYTGKASVTPPLGPGNGQQFTITQAFPAAETATVMISSTMNPISTNNATSYTMQFNSLTLSS